METLIVHPKTKEQLAALKAFMKALKVGFMTEKNDKSLYSAEFTEKMKKSEEDVKARRITKVEPADIWKLT